MSVMLKKLRNSEAGFTLAELLIVVGIVVALAGVILPNVGRFAGEGQRGGLAAEMSSVQTAIDAYGVDNQITPLPIPTDWVTDFLTGNGPANTLNLTGYLRLPQGATITSDRYCWDTYGTLQQEGLVGGTCP